MSDLPGTPRADITPLELSAKLEELTVQVAKLLEAQERTPYREVLPLGAASPKCFIVMPFGSPDLEELYREFVVPTLRECRLECQRGDDMFGSNVVMEDIRDAIASADLIVADLTGQNANVFYEVGIAHTLEKPVLLLSKTIEDVPFDLRHRRVLPYEYTPMGCKRLVARLKEHIISMFQNR